MKTETSFRIDFDGNASPKAIAKQLKELYQNPSTEFQAFIKQLERDRFIRVEGNANDPTNTPYQFVKGFGTISLTKKDLSFVFTMQSSREKDLTPQALDEFIKIMLKTSRFFNLKNPRLIIRNLPEPLQRSGEKKFNELTGRSTQSREQHATFFPTQPNAMAALARGLRDKILASEHVSPHQHLTSSDIDLILQHLLPESFIPTNQALGNLTYEDIQKSDQKRGRIRPYVFAVNPGNHWGTIKIDESEVLHYFDPLHRAGHDVRHITASIKKFFPTLNIVIEVPGEQLDEQNDAWSCGYRAIKRILMERKSDHPITRANNTLELRDAVWKVMCEMTGKPILPEQETAAVSTKAPGSSGKG